MVADVPLGAFLSGGVDSSTIVALMQTQSETPVKTFTIGFSDRAYDESRDAAAVAKHLGTNHTELIVSREEAQAVIPRLPEIYDEPFADSSQIPTFLVSQMARQHVTVSLSGDGGDEVFGGYNRYSYGPRVWNRVRHIPRVLREPTGSAISSVSPRTWDRALGWTGQRMAGDKMHKLARALSSTNQTELYRRLTTHWEDAESILGINTFLPYPTLREDRFAEDMMAVDAAGYLPDDILTKLDRATMAVGLEGRVPFLDHRVVEFAWRLPLSMKIRNGKGKWILRKLLTKYVPSALTERPKMGFGVPIYSWLRGPLRPWAEDLLDASRLKREGYLRPEPIRRVWAEHLSGKRNNQYLLWDVLMFQQWLEHQNA
jgi:asparagine synthase (glutamine-hydrolysing)